MWRQNNQELGLAAMTMLSTADLEAQLLPCLTVLFITSQQAKCFGMVGRTKACALRPVPSTQSCTSIRNQGVDNRRGGCKQHLCNNGCPAASADCPITCNSAAVAAAGPCSGSRSSAAFMQPSVKVIA
jgi:hypothetical protein